MKITLDLTDDEMEDVWEAVCNSREEMYELIQEIRESGPQDDLDEKQLKAGIANLNSFMTKWCAVPKVPTCTCSSRDLLIGGCTCGWKK